MAGKVTTISTQLGGQNVTVRARNGAAVRRLQFTTDIVKDSDQLVRMLNMLVSAMLEAVAVANSSPITSAVILQNVALTSGSTTNIQHGLGRNPTGWLCIRAQTAAFSAFETTLSSGQTRDRYLALRSANTGTYDFLVF